MPITLDYITLLVWFITQLLEIYMSCSLTLGTQGKDPVLGNNLLGKKRTKHYLRGSQDQNTGSVLLLGNSYAITPCKPIPPIRIQGRKCTQDLTVAGTVGLQVQYTCKVVLLKEN